MVMILELCRMKNKIFIFLAIFLFFYPVKAELIFENDFPKKFQGIWSMDCQAGLQVHVIGKISYCTDPEYSMRVLLVVHQLQALSNKRFSQTQLPSGFQHPQLSQVVRMGDRQ